MVILRSVLAVLVGAMVSFVIVMAVEAVNSQIYPMPQGIDFNDSAAMSAFIQTLPAPAFVVVLVGWAIGTMAGAWTASRLAGWGAFNHGILVTAVLLAAGIANMSALPHPTWVWVAGILVFVLSGYVGAKLASRSTPTM